MPYRRCAEQLGLLRQRLEAFCRDGGTPRQALSLLQEACEQLRAHEPPLQAEREHIEQLLAQREQRYRSLFEYNLDTVFYLDTQARLTEINPAAVQLTGYSRQELLGMPVIELCVPERRPAAMQRFAEVLAGGPSDLETAIVHRDGRRIDVYVTGGPIVVDGKTTGVFGIARDVTEARRSAEQIQRLNEHLEHRVVERTARLEAANRELSDQVRQRQQIEQELRTSEGKYRGIVESTHDVIMLTRSDGIITYMSPATRDVLGYEPEELVGRQPWITHIGDLERVRQVHAEALAGRPGIDYEYRVITKAGRVKWVSHSWSIIPGKPYHMIVSVVRDITERKAAQHRIERHETQLRALASELVLAEERERRRLAGDLHDDLCQKLAVAKIRLRVLAQGVAGGDARTSLERVSQIIDEAMQSARSLTFQLCPPALYDLGFVPAVEWLVDDMQQRYGLRVHLADDGRSKPLEERIRVALFRGLRELLINVAKHAGTSAARVELRRVDGQVEVEVRDEGAGFDPAAVAATADRRGFGLFSIQERMGYLGGHVEIHSRPGCGTTVRLRVPVQPEAATSAEDSA